MEFQEFFRKACGRDDNHQFKPYDYQEQLATDAWPDLLDVPTGMGKTAAVALAWLYKRGWRNRRRAADPNADTPRRLVWCLPMRVLVEQTEQNIRQWAKNLGVLGEAGEKKVSVHVLMGGASDLRSWAEYPEEDMVLIGTQDMLLSGALMRGYGMSRYEWPVHFGFLNQDCFWIMDEIQLMGPGLWTSSQLDWMRTLRFPTLKPCRTLWMSATIGTSFLATKDRVVDGIDKIDPCTPDIANDPKTRTLREAKRPIDWFKANKKADSSLPALIARDVEQKHQAGTLSLVVCNTVDMAHAVFDAIPIAFDPILLTSQFRRKDRQHHEKRLLRFEEKRRGNNGRPIPDDKGLICVSTQVVEAGLDISAHQLWSELAPWPSVIQRLGRLNRDGKDQTTHAWFWETPKERRGKQLRIGPYEASDIALAKKLFNALVPLTKGDSSWKALRSLNAKLKPDAEAALQPKPTPLPRALDLHGLFSTERDVHGGFTDVSAFVRGIDPDADLTVFWREWQGKSPPFTDDLEGPPLDVQREGCFVAFSRVRDMLKGLRANAWLWNDRHARWERVSPGDLRPGMVVMLHSDVGGYRRTVGWTGNKQDKLDGVDPAGTGRAFKDDVLSDTGYWAGLDVHLADARQEAEQLCDTVGLLECDPLRTAVVEAAALHDLGKAHPKWQQALPATSALVGRPWAKCPSVAAIDTLASDEALAAAILRLRPDAVRLPDEARRRNRKEIVRMKWAVAKKLQRSELDELKRLAGVLWSGHVSFRPDMRHEMASALAMWQRYRDGKASYPALAVYLAATHHGKVRTVLRAISSEGDDVFGVPRNPTALEFRSESWPLNFSVAKDGAEGRWQGDEFILTDYGWTGLVADLLGPWRANDHTSAGVVPENEPRRLGPFALAYLEALVRIADWRASDKPSRGIKPGEEPPHD